MNKFFLICSLTILFFSFTCFAEIYPILVRPLINDSLQPNASFLYNFTFSDSITCSPELYNSGEVNITLDSTGYGFTELNISNLTLVPEYLCEYRNGSIRRVHKTPDIVADRILTKVVQVESQVKTPYINSLTGYPLYVSGYSTGDILQIDLIVGDTTEGSLRVGGISMAYDDDLTVGGVSYNKTAIIFNNALPRIESGMRSYSFFSSIYEILNLVDYTVGRAHQSPTSFIIGGADPTLFDQNSTLCSKWFDKIDCGLNVGADVGVYDDLEVNGMLYADGGINVSGQSVCLSNGTNCLNVTQSGWIDTGTEVVLVTNTDYVGIGNDTPSFKLTVVDTAGSTTPLGISGGSGNSLINYLEPSTQNTGMIAGYTTNVGADGFIIMNSSGSLGTLLKVTTDGKLGVKNSNPNFALDVNGFINDSVITTIHGTGNARIDIKGNPSRDPSINLNEDNLTRVAYYYDVGGNSLITETFEAGSKMIFEPVNTEMMRLTTTGLGIKTTNPTQELTVNGTILATDGTNYVRIDSNGNYYTWGGTRRVYDNQAIWELNSGPQYYKLVYNQTNGNYEWRNFYGNFMIMDLTNGRVKIEQNMSVPDTNYTLEVVGNASISDFLLVNNTLVCLADGTNCIDLTNWTYANETYVLKSGDTISGDLNITGNLNVTGNISANYFIGNGSLLTDVQVTDHWVNETGDTMTGNLDVQANVSADRIVLSDSSSGENAKIVDSTFYYILDSDIGSARYPYNAFFDTRWSNSLNPYNYTGSTALTGITSRATLNGIGKVSNLANYDSTWLWYQNASVGNFYDYKVTSGNYQGQGGGIMTNRYGLFISDISSPYVTNAWGVYQNGENVSNYFAGNITTDSYFIGNGSLITDVCLSDGSNCADLTNWTYANETYVLKSGDTMTGRLDVNYNGATLGVSSPNGDTHIIFNQSTTTNDAGLFDIISRRNADGMIGSLRFYHSTNYPTGPSAQISGTQGSTTNNGYLRFYTSNAERLRITEDGNLNLTTGIYYGDGSGLTNLSINWSYANDTYVKKAGDTMTGTLLARDLSVNGTFFVDGSGTGYFIVNNEGDFSSYGAGDYLMNLDRYIWRILGLETLGQYINLSTTAIETKDFAGANIMSQNVLSKRTDFWGHVYLSNTSKMYLQEIGSSASPTLWIGDPTNYSKLGIFYVDSSDAFVFGKMSNGARLQFDSSALKVTGNYPFQLSKTGTYSSPAMFWQDDGSTGPYLESRGAYCLSANYTQGLCLRSPFNYGSSGGVYATIYGDLNVSGRGNVYASGQTFQFKHGQNSDVGLTVGNLNRSFVITQRSTSTNNGQTEFRIYNNQDFLYKGFTADIMTLSPVNATIYNHFKTTFDKNVTMKENLNVTGTIRSDNKLVCLQDGTNCPTSVGLWTNDSTKIYPSASAPQNLFINGTINATGNVTAEDCISNNRAYFQIYRTDSFDMISATSWYDYPWTNESAMLNLGFTHNKSGPTPTNIQIDNAGIYRISYTFNCKEPSNNPLRCAVRMFDGATELKGSYSSQHFSSGRGSISNSFIANLSSSSSIKAQVSTSDAGSDIIYYDGNEGNPQTWISAQLSIDRIGVA